MNLDSVYLDPPYLDPPYLNPPYYNESYCRLIKWILLTFNPPSTYPQFQPTM